MYFNRAFGRLLCVLLLTATCSSNGDTTLTMFVKDDYLKCVAEGPLASSAILWTPAHLSANSEFLFKPSSDVARSLVDPLNCSPTAADCRNQGQDLGNWRARSSVRWSLPTVNDYRWEMLPTIETPADRRDFSKKVSLPQSSWKISLSVQVENDAYIELCEGDNPGNNRCYWLIINGWPQEQYKSGLRRCEDGIPTGWPQGECATTQRTHTGRIGKENSWLTIQLAWNDGALEVLYQNEESNYRQLFEPYGDQAPFTLQYLFLRSKNMGLWRLHQYTVLGSTEAEENQTLRSKWFKPSAAQLCISFFYIIYPGHHLTVSLNVGKPIDTLVHLDTVREGDPTQDNIKWQEKRLAYNLSNVGVRPGQFPYVQVIFEGGSTTRNSQNQLTMVIDSVRECDINGDVRVSTVQYRGKISPSFKPECYLAQQESLRVAMNVDNGVTYATTQDILAAGRLCSRINNSQTCEQMILCTANHCACSPGYYATFCRPYCGQHLNSPKNKFGPGCSVGCGKCSSTVPYCHHITGNCPNEECQYGYKPPQCRSRYLYLNSAPAVTATMPTSVNLEFNLGDTTGPEYGYATLLIVEYTNLNDSTTSTKNFSVSNGEMRTDKLLPVTLTGLLASTQYQVRGILVDNNGDAFFMERNQRMIQVVMTSCDADLELYVTRSINSTSAELGTKVKGLPTSCKLDSYRVRQVMPPANREYSVKGELVTLIGLSPYTNYTFKLQQNGRNVDKNVIVFTTAEDAPTEPLNLTHEEVSPEKCTLKWNHPNMPNGKLRSFILTTSCVKTNLRYHSCLAPEKSKIVNVGADEIDYTDTLDLRPSTTYNISVTGVTVSEGTAAHTQVITSLAKPIFNKDDFKVKQTGNTSAVVTIPAAVPELTNNSSYFVVVVPEKVESPRAGVEQELPTKWESILNATSIGSDRGAWIAAELEPQRDSAEFELGNKSRSIGFLSGDNFTNWELKPNAEYSVYLVARNAEGTYVEIGFLKETVILKILGTISLPSGEDGNKNLFALLLLLLIPLLAFFVMYWYRWKLNTQGGEQMMLYPLKKNAEIDVPSVTRAACPNPTPSPVDKTVHNLAVQKSSRVKICDLQSYVSRCVLSGELKKQHEMFPKGQTRPWDCGRLAQNKVKNRYGNQIPYDDTRVKLNKIPNDQFSDYINASYIEGYKQPHMYIATQGPKKQTIQDFWRMVWQENIQVISMLANVIENGKSKCEQYWPENGQEATYGSVIVLTGKVEVFPDYTCRQFYIKLNENGDKRTVRQLHFTTWPDHGVPLYPQSLASYLKKLLAMPLGRGPMLVHCSAGVGRTGTVVVADACLRMAAAEGAVDVLRFLQVARHCRANVVDNFEQYKLIHVVLIECLVAEPTALPCDGSFEGKVKTLKESGAMARLFVDANKVPPPVDDPLDEDDDEAEIQRARLAENEERKHKNRVQDIIPGVSGRVFLFRLDEDDPVSDYINAVSVDGYLIKDQFIATQFPLPGTVGDFWRLIVEKQIPVVVAMNELDLTDETVCLFWPALNQVLQPVPHLVVTMVEEYDHEHWKIYTIVVMDQSDTEAEAREWRVTILHLKGWAAGNPLPPPETNNGYTLLELWQETERVYKSDKPIVVCCYDGATACGLFMALSFLIEKMKLEQECDVSQAVRTVKHHRNQFVSTQDQYEWLYTAAVTYLEAFQTYANFQ